MKKKLIRITTVPISLKVLLKGQLHFMNQFYEVIAISSKGTDFEEVLNQEKVIGHSINMSRQITPLKDLIALIRLILVFIKEKPFIVHTHTPKAGTLGMIAAYICRVPNRLHTVAGLPLLETSGSKRKLLDFVEKVTYACATKVYPNSFEMEKIILKNGFTKVSKTKVIGNGSSNGIDTNYFSLENTPDVIGRLRQELNLKDGDFVYCFIGRIVRDKGIEELISAFDKLSKKISNVKLILVGNFERELDPLTPKTEKIIEKHPSVRFVGYQKDVRPYLAISNEFVFPSYREGFPNVVMQAGAMGLPSIVSNINGCNEIIENNKNGLIVPVKDEKALFDAMLFSVTNKDVMRKMSENAREIIMSKYERKFVWNCIIDEYKSLEI